TVRAYPAIAAAVRWLLDVASQSKAMWEHRVFRIENLDVLEALGLPRREGFSYSLGELRERAAELARQVDLARGVPDGERNLTQLKFLELDEKTKLAMVLMDAFGEADIGGQTRDEVLDSLRAAMRRIESLNRFAPRPLPPLEPAAPWLTVMEADANALLAAADPSGRRQADDAARVMTELLAAYRAEDATKFNGLLAEYGKTVRERAVAEEQYEADLAAAGHASARKAAERLDLRRIAFESWFNHFDPLMICLVFYIVAFVLAAASWLGWFEGLNRTANWLLWLTFALHTFGLICRIYISGRPPVTNLYSSAVFIGWAAVLFALLFEIVYRLGIGNLLAAAIGLPTMIIAYYLTFEFANSGDTFGVMQAVLDTNFWLGTHVVCISLGYTTTLLAGFMGAATILLGLAANVLSADQRRQLARMTYGTLCFAIFFSFIGTVLGGLWADDSWGRFWGWDPKENGALMIVLWNAIILHARWGKFAGERGVAALAVLGNIVVAWSWYGVNQLGIGLHAYGFTSGLTFWLVTFALSQLAIAATAYVAPLLVGRRPLTPVAA
ncbi:MAG TPA: cytochrome c biogenesis protein CcsA, partial [Lacipirellulaceae bacterium]|nr:cytochrome c biogenesis protein CcsA [Lacipirellulaceae bacterium]